MISIVNTAFTWLVEPPLVVNLIYWPAVTVLLSVGVQISIAVAAEPFAIVICSVIFVPPFTFAVITASAVAVVPSIIEEIFEIVPAFGTTTKQVDVAEIHDAFSVCEPMALEAIGFTNQGEGMNLVKNLHETNNFKINSRGGLIGCGHPLGATGISQTIEIVQQLQQSAEGRQVDKPEIGLVHNMSAAATSSTVLVLEKWSLKRN